ncbi:MULTISPECIES: ABC transporter substrate-binding protein [Burkholderiaceae]|uniref:ABC transporter substrate-binding protein n=1 Tax=Caballeronia sordidicola TaxID=196367 RepID=A0A2C9XUP1_CABSO|nr:MULTISPECIES: ABC transporter substrate-binding protein [Burkholderiaceae]AME28109.1 ABC transporter substrate-binding protein [Burkholderia sp. PAMC 26561]OTP65988.1 ABC transporter substrate-binding protein [Caballeronia sordidicola]
MKPATFRLRTRSTIRKFVVAMCLASLLEPAIAEEKKVVVSEAFQALHYLPLYVAINKGFFTEQGLSVTKLMTGTPSNALSAVISGSADFAIVGPEWAAVAAEKGAAVEVVSNLANGAGAWVATSADFEYDGPKSLKDQRVVTGMMPTTSTSLFIKMLRENGMQPSDVHMLQVPIGSEIGPMLAAQVKVGVFYEPGLEQVVAGGQKVVVSFAKLNKEYLFAAVTARKNVDPEVGRRFVAGMQKAFLYMAASPQEVKLLARKEFPTISPEIVDAAISRMLADGVFSKSVAISHDSLRSAMQTQIDLGNLKQQPVYDALIDHRFIDAAVKEVH